MVHRMNPLRRRPYVLGLTTLRNRWYRPLALRSCMVALMIVSASGCITITTDSPAPCVSGLSAEEIFEAFEKEHLIPGGRGLLGPDSGPEASPQMCDAWTFYLDPDPMTMNRAYLFRCDRESRLRENIDFYGREDADDMSRLVLTYDCNTIGLILPDSVDMETVAKYNEIINELILGEPQR